ncbi:MAG: hypothetical protein ACYSVY_11035 [Planctomycetota bacterium]|jgi:hypothetical protein
MGKLTKEQLDRELLELIEGIEREKRTTGKGLDLMRAFTNRTAEQRTE